MKIKVMAKKRTKTQNKIIVIVSISNNYKNVIYPLVGIKFNNNVESNKNEEFILCSR